ncbi:hypothetical protein [Corynebacterium parakroppenstedtii]|uniref:hypothetical protein n=1 Tax=Corynebacterium TaxID=1716 RepID=UPI00358DD47F
MNPSDSQRAGYERADWFYISIFLGIDVAGAVDAVDLGGRRCEVGDHVAVYDDIWRHGGFEEYAVVAGCSRDHS